MSGGGNASSGSWIPRLDDVEFYRVHGWVRSGVLLTEPLLTDMAAAAREYLNYRADDGGPTLDPTETNTAGSTEVIDSILHRSARLRQLVNFSEIAAVAGALTGTQSIRLFHSSLSFKPPGSPDSVIGWHTDRAYWTTCTSEAMLTAFIPLHDCDENNGTLLTVDGSHRWPTSDPAIALLRSLKTLSVPDLPRLERIIRSAGYPMEVVPVRLKAGEVSFHNCLTLHASAGNASERPRVAMSIHMQDSDNGFRPVERDGALVKSVFDASCRRNPETGFPDYTDPDVFPTMWANSMRTVPR